MLYLSCSPIFQILAELETKTMSDRERVNPKLSEFFSTFGSDFLYEGSCLPLGILKSAFRIINLLAQIIDQLTQVFNNVSSFVYAALIFCIKATIYN